MRAGRVLILSIQLLSLKFSITSITEVRVIEDLGR